MKRTGHTPEQVIRKLRDADITFATSDASRWSMLARDATAVVRLAMVLVAIISLLAPFGLRVLAPASYVHADLLGVAVVVALAAMPWAVYLPLAQVLVWEERTRPMLVIGPAAAITNLVLAALLLPGYGLQGVAVATFVALSFQAFLCAWAVRRLVSIPGILQASRSVPQARLDLPDWRSPYRTMVSRQRSCGL